MPSPLTPWQRALSSAVRGQVAFDDLTRGLYSTDASLYQIMPLAVVCPLDEADAVAAITAAATHAMPILPRAGGTSLGGSAVGEAVVIDVSRHLTQLLEVNAKERWARVQPGLVRDNLNVLLRPSGLMFAPDPATGSRACIGGMIGNNSSGMRSLLHGKTVDHLLAVKVALPDGRVTWLGTAENDDSISHELRGRTMPIVEANRAEIAARYPKIMRRVQGYNLDELTGPDPNLAKLICGSEGTLATVLEAKIRLVPVPRAVALCVAHFDRLDVALRAVQQIVAWGPSAVEIVDGTVLDLARTNPATENQCGWLVGSPAAVLGIEFCADDEQLAAERAASAAHQLLDSGAAYAVSDLGTSPRQSDFWAVRKAGLGVMTTMPGDRKPMPFIEDCAVPLEVLPEFIDGALKICAKHGTRPTLYAHASVGLIHIRPILTMKSAADVAAMKAIAAETFALVRHYNGSISGEHGDGLARSFFLEEYFGQDLMVAFRNVKAIFDPDGLMNPGKITDGPPIDRNLRLGEPYRARLSSGWYDYSHEQGLDVAIETCNGVGACRQTLVGTMCPTFRATGDEALSTRARANALRLANSGVFDGLGDPALAPTLDTCLACKACKTECPSNVDIARLRAEALAVRADRHGRSARDQAVIASPSLARLACGPQAVLINAVAASRPFRAAGQALLGLDAHRVMPRYASRPFSAWFARRTSRLRSDRRVVLFDDTWLRYHDTQVGIAAVELLESCGYEVLLANAGCCQRPAISHGDLRRAKRLGERTLRNLDRWLAMGVPVVCCEPSCASALVDDLPSLVGDAGLGRRAASGIQMIDVWLRDELKSGRLHTTFTSTTRRILLHGHCHQKALFGTDAMTDLLAMVPGLRVDAVDCGCCGMAGSFGYEAEHFELSQQVAEDRLLPAVRAADQATTIVAPGFSCRHQIADGTGRQAVGWVQVLRGVPKIMPRPEPRQTGAR